MTDERKAELIKMFESGLQPANLMVYDQPDPNVEENDGFVAFYDYLCVTFGKNAEEQAVLDEQLVKTIAAKCGYPIMVVDKPKSGNGHFTVWFKRLPQPETPAPLAHYQKLREEFEEYKIQSRKDYNQLAKEYTELFFFVKNKSPELLAEFRAWKEREQAAAEEKKV